MSAMGGHPLLPMARAFARMPRARNPITNPAAAASMPAAIQQHIAAIQNSPQLAAVAAGSAVNNMDNTSNPMAPVTGGSGASFGAAQGALQPNQAQFRRLPDVRHNVTGMTALVFGAAGSAKGTFTPQTRFKGNRLIMPSSTLAGTTIQNLLVGTRPQYAASSVEPFHMFEEQSTGGVWDLDVCEIGQQIAMTVTVTGATTVFAAIVGEALDGKPYNMLRSPLKRIATTVAGIGAGATALVTVQPQVNFKPRRLIVDDASAANFTINSFLIGISPQFMSGDPVPAGAFTEVAQDVWLDCDEASVGNLITLSVTNTSAGSLTFGLSFLGDIDPRQLQTAFGQY